jgi:hypothetical protein
LIQSRREVSDVGAHKGEVRDAYKILVRKPQGKRQLGKIRNRWEANVKINLKEIRFGRVGCIRVARKRDRWQAAVSTALNFRLA